MFLIKAIKFHFTGSKLMKFCYYKIWFQAFQSFDGEDSGRIKATDFRRIIETFCFPLKDTQFKVHFNIRHQIFSHTQNMALNLNPPPPNLPRADYHRWILTLYPSHIRISWLPTCPPPPFSISQSCYPSTYT